VGLWAKGGRSAAVGSEWAPAAAAAVCFASAAALVAEWRLRRWGGSAARHGGGGTGGRSAAPGMLRLGWEFWGIGYELFISVR
jgi:hypothetical protein